MAGKWLDQLTQMMAAQPQQPPQRLGFAERLIAAGQRPSQHVQIAAPGPDYYDYPADPRTEWTPLGDEVDAQKFENSIGLPSALIPGHETQTRAMPDISQDMYPAGGVRRPDDNMGDQPLAYGGDHGMPRYVPLPPRRPY